LLSVLAYLLCRQMSTCLLLQVLRLLEVAAAFGEDEQVLEGRDEGDAVIAPVLDEAV
jgi:hypothetical protein